MNILRRGLPIILLTVLVFIFFIKFFYPKPTLIYTPDFGLSDAFHFNYSLKDFLSQSLKNNQLPLWSDNIGSGFPVLAEGQIGTFNLSNLVLFKFLPTYLAFNLSIILIFLTLIIGQYLYLTSLNLSVMPALLGTIGFSFSTYFVTKITHFNHIQAASFIPFILFLLEKYIKKQKIRYLIFIAFLFSQLIFSGYPMMVLIAVLLIIFRIVFLFWGKKTKPSQIVFFLVPLIIAAILALGLSAIQLFPQFEYLKLSNLRSGFSFEGIVKYHYHPKNLLRFLHPYLIGNPTKGNYDPVKYGIFWENSSFLGIIPLILACCSLFYFKKSWVKYFSGLILISLILSFGRNSPFYFVFTIFPFNLFRVPSRYLLIAIFSLSCLSAFFLEKIKQGLNKKAFFLLSGIFIIFTFLQLYSFFSSYHLLVSKERLLDEPEALTLLKKEKDLKKIYEYGNFSSWYKYFESNWQNESMFIFLKNTLMPNSSLIWQIASENAYFTQLPLRLSSYENLILKKDAQIIIKGLQVAGISHLILPNEVEHKSLEKVKELQFHNEEIYLYKVSSPNPKFWIAKDYKAPVKTAEEVKRIINSSDFNYQEAITLEREINLSLSPDDNPALEIVKDLPQHKQIKISQNKNSSLLVINQSFYPGWQAFIDGRETEILAANLNQQALVVPPGDQVTINLLYQSASFYLGIKISIICLLILTALLVLFQNKNLRSL